MTTDSEKCVDELLKRLTELDAFLSDLKSKKPDDSLMIEAREQLTSIQSFIDNNHALIPPYCLKKAVDSVKRLEDFVNKSHESKIKFQFKTNNLQPSNKNKPIEQQQETALFTPVQGTTIGFSGKTNESLSLGQPDVDSKDITLSNLTCCDVVIRGLANTVYINDLKDTSVSVGIACRAVTVKKCSNCKFTLVCQQLRIDSTLDSKFEIFTSARSMLESSSGLEFKRFHPDNEIVAFMLKSNIDIGSNNWKCIDDFDWLSPNAPSQHYGLVEDN